MSGIPLKDRSRIGRYEDPRNKDRGKAPPRRVGFYGCEDRLVRVEQREVGYSPKDVQVEGCPACGRDHPAKIMWRAYRAVMDDAKEADLWV